MREVDLLRRIIDGGVNENNLGNADWVGRLRNAGIIDRDAMTVIDDRFRGV